MNIHPYRQPNNGYDLHNLPETSQNGQNLDEHFNNHQDFSGIIPSLNEQQNKKLQQDPLSPHIAASDTPTAKTEIAKRDLKYYPRQPDLKQDNQDSDADFNPSPSPKPARKRRCTRNSRWTPDSSSVEPAKGKEFKKAKQVGKQTNDSELTLSMCDRILTNFSRGSKLILRINHPLLDAPNAPGSVPVYNSTPLKGTPEFETFIGHALQAIDTAQSKAEAYPHLRCVVEVISSATFYAVYKNIFINDELAHIPGDDRSATLAEKISQFKNGEPTTLRQSGLCLPGVEVFNVNIHHVCGLPEAGRPHQSKPFSRRTWRFAFSELHLVRSDNVIDWLVFLFTGLTSTICGNLDCQDVFHIVAEGDDAFVQKMGCNDNRRCTCPLSTAMKCTITQSEKEME